MGNQITLMDLARGQSTSYCYREEKKEEKLQQLLPQSVCQQQGHQFQSFNVFPKIPAQSHSSNQLSYKKKKKKVKLLKSPTHLLVLTRSRTFIFAYLCKKSFGKCIYSIYTHTYFYVRT